MTMIWRALHAHTGAIDPMVLEIVGPFLDRNEARLQCAFWERHYAGGPNLRIRLQAEAGWIDELICELRGSLENWLATNGTPPLANYSSDHAARLLRSEGVDPATEDLAYRNSEVVERDYPESGKVFASPAARQLAETFRQRRSRLAIDIMRADSSRHELMLRFYIVLALFIGRGSCAVGSVSYKSHWEGFYATLANVAVAERVAENYRRQRERLMQIVREVQSAWQADQLASSPPLDQWLHLLQETAGQVTAILQSGEALSGRPANLEAAAAARIEFLSQNVRRSSEFVETLWADDEFMTSVHDDIYFQRPRTLINLMYDLLAAVGLTPLDKMALCHHAHRVVEEIEGCDLNDLLRSNMAAVKARRRIAAAS